MKTLVLLAASLTIGPAYELDLQRYYFASPGTEEADRSRLLSDVEVFLRQPASSLDAPSACSRWLADYDSLSKRLKRHSLYLYVRAEADSNNHADAAASEVVDDARTRVDAAVQRTLATLGTDRLHAYLASDTTLAPYRYFIDSTLTRAAQEPAKETPLAGLTSPALSSLSGSYRLLSKRLRPAASNSPATGAVGFEARWKPYLDNEDEFASLLVPIVMLHNVEAKLQGFADAPAASYFRAGLTAVQVSGALEAIRASAAHERYVAVLAAAASRRLGVAPAALHAWDLDEADNYTPDSVAFADAVPMILAAVRSMGSDYAAQYARLFDPAAGRVEWCHAEECDHTGFSLGYAGLTSGLFFGAYTGDTNSIRAVAHEAGHAVHREFITESQPLAVYSTGPKFMFESFAIFNEFLLLDHLYRTAGSRKARAYYLKQLLDDAVFQTWGSAKETDLEQSIYAAAADRKLNQAADLDALTLQTFAHYVPAPSLDPAMKVYWARNRLYFTDPIYDVNYLFAGLLALEYLQRFEQDPKGFPHRYVALLKNGFTDTPQALTKAFLGINLEDTKALVGDASDLIGHRTEVLADLYGICHRAASACLAP